ncbi:hypothetical protein L5515_009240 [Caenorhabditis briggsae]|uniref:Uncharacterized protein n=1 Tax=Caenorhabditis briggsae TaxID=6238 RepID=A0AAE9JNG2_CAEBR|nr:hypothetical protein L5515_009240 [Caenorhabditis briggsae]
MATPLPDMSPGNCTIDYSIPYHWIMEYSPFVSVWFYIYIVFFVVEQNGSLKLSHQHTAILNHHFWNFIHQIYVCIFYRPVAHLPMFGFQIGGVVRTWELNAIELWIVWVWVVFVLLLSMVHLFYARLYTISRMMVLNKYRSLIHLSTVVFILSIFVSLGCGSSILLVFLSTPFVVQIKMGAFNTYNSRIIFCPDFAIVDLSMWQTILPNALAAGGLAVLFFIMVFMGIASLIVLSTKSPQSSVKTLRTQKQLMQSFVIQVCTHTMFLFIPVVTCAILAFFKNLTNVAIYTTIFCLVHQGVITIIVFAVCTPMTTKVAKSFSVVRFVHYLLSIVKWFICCGVLTKKQMPSLVQVNVGTISKWSPHPTTQTHNTTTHMI